MSDSDLQIKISVDSSAASSGAEQAKSAVASVAAQVQALGGVFGSLSKDLTDGLDGLKKLSAAFEGLSKGAQHAQSAGAALKGLGADISTVAGKAASSSAGIERFGAQITLGLSEPVAESAGKLALLGEAASGFAGMAMAVGQAAFMAGKATLEWAQQAQNAATATAQQKANASALVTVWNGADVAAKRVGDVFNSVGAALAGAFAPAVTAAISLMTDLANRLADSHTKGGLLKTAVDLLTGAVDAAARAAQTEDAITTAASAAAQQRASANASANAAIATSNSATTVAFASDQAQQVAMATDSDKARVASNNAANRLMAEANDKALKQFQSSMNKLVNTFADGLVKMAEGAKSFGQVMRQLSQQILDDIVRVVIGMVEKWAWGETEKVLATQRGQMLLQALGLKELALEIAADARKVASNAAANAAKVASNNAAATAGQGAQLALTLTTLKQDAAKVFGGIFAALSSNPFTLPAAAPAAAAGAAAVMSFSAAGGYDIPAGVNPLTQLHAQEMVLPARLANPMRDMLASFDSGSAQSPIGHTFSFGDTHIHGAPNMSPADFKQALAEHRASVAGAVADALRSGWRPTYRQPVGAL